ncbi:tRNA (guanine(37)-N1)-methyltransferase [Cryptosporidium felis]|nr:tRNA (guanine(37)-N1)-methyltransferase [Cryptosporidium felis]
MKARKEDKMEQGSDPSRFDSSKIFKCYNLPYIKVKREDCNYVSGLFREGNILFKFPRVSPVLNDENDGKRIILLSERLKESQEGIEWKRQKLEDDFEVGGVGRNEYIIELGNDLRIKLGEKVFKGLDTVEYSEFGILDFKVEYKYLSYVECARQVVPENVEVISSFETIGHIAHLNLDEKSFQYRHILAEILLDKNPAIKTVVTKTGNIESIFRTYPLEVIGGEDNLKARLKEQGIVYNIEIDKVYWNSRLSNERQRIVEMIPDKSFVFDLTCGVGAFTLPLIKVKDCNLYSNDLNPDAVRLLRDNIVSNKLKENKVVTSQKDCIECIRDLLNKRLNPSEIFNLEFHLAGTTSQENRIFYWICNLPELSLNMLAGFVSYKEASLTKDTEGRDNPQFEVTTNHFLFYCFSKDNNPHRDIKERIYLHLQLTDTNSTSKLFFPENLSIHEVRDVSPSKKMYCAQFTMLIPVPTSFKLPLKPKE